MKEKLWSLDRRQLARARARPVSLRLKMRRRGMVSILIPDKEEEEDILS